MFHLTRSLTQSLPLSLSGEHYKRVLQNVVEQNTFLVLKRNAGSHRCDRRKWKRKTFNAEKRNNYKCEPNTKSSPKAQRSTVIGVLCAVCCVCERLFAYANIGTNTIFKMARVAGHAFWLNFAQSHAKPEMHFEMGKVQNERNRNLSVCVCLFHMCA